MIGIYVIENKLNNRKYVGQSVEIEERFKRHIRASKNKNAKTYNYPLMRAFRKYGIKNFTFKVLELTDKKDLNIKEEYWVNKLDTFENGYNQKEGGEYASVIQKITPKKLRKITKLLKEGKHTQKEIAKMFGVSKEMIHKINVGKYWKRDIEYPISTPKTPKGGATVHLCPVCLIKVSAKGNHCHKCALEKNRLVERPDKKTLAKMIVESSFTAVANKFGVSDNAVKKWCDAYNIGKLKKEVKAWYLSNAI